MVDPLTGIALTSSLVTIVEIGYKIIKRTSEFSHLLGDLPPDLQSCKDLVDIIVRTGERLQRKYPLAVGDGAIHGPPTELQADLEILFAQCHETATSFSDLLSSLEGSGVLSKAITLARKEGKIAQIRSRLDQHVLAILFALGEDQNKSDTEVRDIAIDLKKDFYRFHEDVVSQISASHRQLETVVRDTAESLLQDLRPHLSTRDQKFESSTLRLLGGQQDLSQNLERIERTFNHALRSGETSLAAQIQDQLSGQQATTRMLFESVSQRQDVMHSHLKHLHEEVTTHLDRLEKVRKESSHERRAPHLQLKASFEFTYRSDFVALHVSHGIDWMSSNLLFPKIKASRPGALCSPGSRMRSRSGIQCNHLDTTPRRHPLNVVIKWDSNQYHLIKVDLSEERYQNDVNKAIKMTYSSYRGLYWKLFSSKDIVGVEYVKYGSYSTELNCFECIETITARPAAGVSDRPGQKHTPFTAPIHAKLMHDLGGDGYALYLREDFKPIFVASILPAFKAFIITMSITLIIALQVIHIFGPNRSAALLFTSVLVTAHLATLLVLRPGKFALQGLNLVGSCVAYALQLCFYRPTNYSEEAILGRFSPCLGFAVFLLSLNMLAAYWTGQLSHLFNEERAVLVL